MSDDAKPKNASRATRPPGARSPKLRAIAAGAGLVVGLAALAHVPALQRLTGSKGCPFDPNGRAPSPEKLEDYRVKSLASLRTGENAKARPALGFTLGASTKDEVNAWASAAGLACRDETGGAASRCVPGSSARVDGRDVEDAFFRFDPGGRLVAADVYHARTTPARAAETVKALATSLEAEIGAASAVRGEPTEANLGGGRLSRVAFEFRFGDYAADLSATSFADDASARDAPVVSVREQYRLLVATANATARR